MDVYWSPYIIPAFYDFYHESYSTPEPLASNLSKIRNNESDNKNSWYSCPATNSFMKNTFIIKNPNYLNFYINENGKSFWPDGTSADSWCSPRTPAVKKSLTIDISMGIIFFCKEDLTITTMSPFMHNTEYSKYGHYVPGTFNIGNWFRPVDFSFQLWENQNKFISEFQEPSIYIKFNTEEKINLKKFKMTEDIYQISNECISFKKKKPKTQLNYLYSIFSDKKKKEMSYNKYELIKLIQKNIIS